MPRMVRPTKKATITFNKRACNSISCRHAVASPTPTGSTLITSTTLTTAHPARSSARRSGSSSLALRYPVMSKFTWFTGRGPALTHQQLERRRQLLPAAALNTQPLREQRLVVLDLETQRPG